MLYGAIYWTVTVFYGANSATPIGTKAKTQLGRDLDWTKTGWRLRVQRFKLYNPDYTLHNPDYTRIENIFSNFHWLIGSTERWVLFSVHLMLHIFTYSKLTLFFYEIFFTVHNSLLQLRFTHSILNLEDLNCPSSPHLLRHFIVEYFFALNIINCMLIPFSRTAIIAECPGGFLLYTQGGGEGGYLHTAKITRFKFWFQQIW